MDAATEAENMTLTSVNDIVSTLKSDLSTEKLQKAFDMLIDPVDALSTYRAKLLNKHHPDTDLTPSLVLTSVPGVSLLGTVGRPGLDARIQSYQTRINVATMMGERVLHDNTRTMPYELVRRIDEVLDSTLYRGSDITHPLVRAQAQISIGQSYYDQYPAYSEELIATGLVSLKFSETHFHTRQLNYVISRRNDVLEVLKRLGKFYVSKNNFNAALDICRRMSAVVSPTKVDPKMHIESDERSYAADVILDMLFKLNPTNGDATAS